MRSSRRAVSRFRPIMLTAISTVLGLIPIAITIFWGPMAFAVMGGLLVATVLTLIFLPALYVAWFRVKEPAAAGRKVMSQPYRHGPGMNPVLSRSAVLARASDVLGVWVVLSGLRLRSIVVPGVVAALAATWAQPRLLPSGPNRLQLARLGQIRAAVSAPVRYSPVSMSPAARSIRGCRSIRALCAIPRGCRPGRRETPLRR